MDKTTTLIVAIIVGGIIGAIFSKKKSSKSNPNDIDEIIKNDEVLKQIDKNIGDLNDEAYESLKDDEDAMAILRKEGIIDNNFDVDAINKIKIELQSKFESLVSSGKIPSYFYDEVKAEWETWGSLEQFENGETELAVSEGQWYEWGNNYIKLGLRLGDLIIKYGESKGEKIFLKEVWKGMTLEELMESRGEPDKVENVELENGSHLIYSYGHKNTGSYFKIKEDVVIEFTDRMNKRNLLSNI